jgi:hypothetical protein
MTDYPPLSKLPEEQSYWDDLETRIMADLRPRVRAASERRPDWWKPLAARAWGLSGLAVAAGIAALALVPARGLEPETSVTGILRLPDDDAAVTAFLSAPAPPALASLVLAPFLGNEDE